MKDYLGLQGGSGELAFNSAVPRPLGSTTWKSPTSVDAMPPIVWNASAITSAASGVRGLGFPK